MIPWPGRSTTATAAGLAGRRIVESGPSDERSSTFFVVAIVSTYVPGRTSTTSSATVVGRSSAYWIDA
jgi:hypothetical protein